MGLFRPIAGQLFRSLSSPIDIGIFVGWPFVPLELTLQLSLHVSEAVVLPLECSESE
jgi:hypothetical protein